MRYQDDEHLINYKKIHGVPVVLHQYLHVITCGVEYGTALVTEYVEKQGGKSDKIINDY
jgi:hypothetical protein